MYFIEGRGMQLPKKYLFLNFEFVSGVSSDFPRQSLRRNIRYSTVLFSTYYAKPSVDKGTVPYRFLSFTTLNYNFWAKNFFDDHLQLLFFAVRYTIYVPETHIMYLTHCCGFLKISEDCCCFGGGGVLLGYSAYIISL